MSISFAGEVQVLMINKDDLAVFVPPPTVLFNDLNRDAAFDYLAFRSVINNRCPNLSTVLLVPRPWRMGRKSLIKPFYEALP